MNAKAFELLNWTNTNASELRRKRLKLYPLRFRPEGVLSRYTLVGNLGHSTCRSGAS